MVTILNYQQRKTQRLKGYDYAESGSYFVTICSFNRRAIFGIIEDATLAPSCLGDLVIERWQMIPQFFPHVELDMFVLMPNHVHGILHLRETSRFSLSAIVNGFKGSVTRNAEWSKIGLPIWQRGFHDKIIRDEASLLALRQYIVDNPAQWYSDDLNPARF